ncbi:MAG: TRAP transporter small permease [Alphaproteobacteria bacterium]|nr:TRAP transporter small permease [Alphaproteobacteria bacterium]
MDGLRRGLTRLADVCEGASAVALGVVIVLNAIAVFARYVLTDPIGWSEELMRFSLAWLTYLAVGPCLFRNEHMAMETLDVIRNEAVKRALLRFNLAVTGLFAGTILWFAIPLLQRNWNQFTPVMEIRTFWPYLSVALGCALLVLFAIGMIALSFKGRAHRDSDDEPAGAA